MAPRLTPLRLAIVGYGGSGRAIHARLAKEVGLPVTAVVTRDAIRRQQAAFDWPGAKLHDDLDGLVAARAGFDIVVVAYREGGETGEKVGAIIVPNPDAFPGLDFKNPEHWTEVEARVRQVVQKQCTDLADYKHPRKLDIRRDPLERTSTQKVRRHVYNGQLDVK